MEHSMCPQHPPREPASPDEERAVEAEELESFKRRRQWADDVLGDVPPDRADDVPDEGPDDRHDREERNEAPPT